MGCILFEVSKLSRLWVPLTLLMSQSLMAQTTQSAPATKPKLLPIVARDDFESGKADRWQPTDASAWKVRHADGKNHVYSQHKKRSDYKPPFRSPFNVSVLKEVVVGDFELTARVLSTHKDYNHRDACLFFGYQDPAHFYYVHFGKKTDPHANQIFIVNGAARTKISLKTTPGTNWDEKWHSVKIVRKPASGLIEVYFDDMRRPVMTAKDSTFAWGQIGLGSFDDTADWDDVVLRGTRIAPPRKAR